MKSYVFRVVVEEDAFEDGRRAYQAYVPGLKGCRTWGHTYDEALVNLREALELYVEDILASGEDLPLDPGDGILKREGPSVAVNVR